MVRRARRWWRAVVWHRLASGPAGGGSPASTVYEAGVYESGVYE